MNTWNNFDDDMDNNGKTGMSWGGMNSPGQSGWGMNTPGQSGNPDEMPGNTGNPSHKSNEQMGR